MKTIIWSKDNCPYCTKAKHLLDLKGLSFEERNLSSNEWSKEQLLEDMPTAKTVPQIWMHGKYVGGYTDLVQYYEDHNMWMH